MALAKIRGFAAILVTIGHLEQIFIHPVNQSFSRIGGLLAQSSVMMFFVVSGISIAASAARSLAGPNPLLEYSVNRASRIIPPLCFSIGVMWLLSLAADFYFPGRSNEFLQFPGNARNGFFFSWVDSAGAMVFLNGFVARTPSPNGPLWSLSFEVWLYVLYFGAIVTLKKHSWARLGIVFSLFATLAICDRSGDARMFLRCSVVWIAGVATFFLLARRRKAPLPSTSYIPISIFLVSGVALGFSVCYSIQYLSGGIDSNIENFNLAFGIAFAGFIATGLRTVPTRIGGLFLAASRFSYTLYLIHFPIFLFIYGVFQRVTNSGFVGAVSVGLLAWTISVVVGWLSAKWLEDRSLWTRIFGLSTISKASVNVAKQVQ